MDQSANQQESSTQTPPVVSQDNKDVVKLRRVKCKCCVTNPVVVVPPSNADLSGWETMAKQC